MESPPIPATRVSPCSRSGPDPASRRAKGKDDALDAMFRGAAPAGSRWPTPAAWKPCGCCGRERRQSSAAARPCSNWLRDHRNDAAPAAAGRMISLVRPISSPAGAARSSPPVCSRRFATRAGAVVRRLPDPRIEWEDATPPSQPRRQPPSQLRPAHGRRVPNANRRADPSLARRTSCPNAPSGGGTAHRPMSLTNMICIVIRRIPRDTELAARPPGAVRGSRPFGIRGPAVAERNDLGQAMISLVRISSPACCWSRRFATCWRCSPSRRACCGC